MFYRQCCLIPIERQSSSPLIIRNTPVGEESISSICHVEDTVPLLEKEQNSKICKIASERERERNVAISNRTQLLHYKSC